MSNLHTRYLWAPGDWRFVVAASACWGGNTMRVQFWWLLEYQIVIFRMKIQGLSYIGCTWQWHCWRHCFGYFLQVKVYYLRSGDDNACAFPSWRHCFCRASFAIRLINFMLVRILLPRLVERHGWVFLFLYFPFWLCALLMSSGILLVYLHDNNISPLQKSDLVSYWG
jgi:hypothetical protein